MPTTKFVVVQSVDSPRHATPRKAELGSLLSQYLDASKPNGYDRDLAGRDVGLQPSASARCLKTLIKSTLTAVLLFELFLDSNSGMPFDSSPARLSTTADRVPGRNTDEMSPRVGRLYPAVHLAYFAWLFFRVTVASELVWCRGDASLYRGSKRSGTSRIELLAFAVR